MRDFAAIDFETANNERSSVCSVGVVIVRDGEIVDSFYSLIQPEPNYYNYWCSQVHGLCREDTEEAPVFPKVLENHQLHTVAAECGYCLENHHHALADAEACAWIAREIL